MSASPSSRPDLSPARPNIVLITTDQHRGDSLGIEGHPVLQTPNLDWLARSGTHFRRGYSECPSCVPARRTLMSGQAPATHGMVGMTTAEWSPSHTLAGELSRAGYQTQLVGKLHLSQHRRRFGFDHMVLADSTHRGSAFQPPHNDYVDWLESVGGGRWEPGIAHGVSPNGWVGRPHYLPEEKTHTFWCTSKAMEFIHKRDPEVPFFLNLSYIDPHPPLTPPRFYYDRYIHRDLPMPFVGDWAPTFDGPQKGLDVNAHEIRLDEAAMRCARAGYYGLVNHVDDQIGRLVDFLRRQGLLENTFILFTADHGEMLGDHNMFRKTFAYEPSARVPFLVKAAATMDCPAEVVSHAPVGLQDVLPTLLEVAGAPVPDTVTGMSLLPLMRDDRDASWRELLHGEHAGQYRYDDAMHFVTDGRVKYVWYSQTGHEHLFDLEADPNELHNLADPSSARDLWAEWRRKLAACLKDRPEGFSDGERLVAGKPHEMLVPTTLSAE